MSFMIDVLKAVIKNACKEMNVDVLHTHVVNDTVYIKIQYNTVLSFYAYDGVTGYTIVFDCYVGDSIQRSVNYVAVTNEDVVKFVREQISKSC